MAAGLHAKVCIAGVMCQTVLFWIAKYFTGIHRPRLRIAPVMRPSWRTYGCILFGGVRSGLWEVDTASIA